MEQALKPPVKPKRIEPDPEDPAMVLTHADVAHISAACKRNILEKDQLLRAVSEMTTLTVEGVAVTLEPRLLGRLKSRCLDKPNFPTWLTSVVIKQLHDYAGY